MSMLLSLVILVAPQAQAPGPGMSQGPGMAPGRGALMGGVAEGVASPDVLALSLDDAIARGLKHNLALLLAEQNVRTARGSRLEALSDLLPHLSGRLTGTREKINLQAFGFSSFPGIPTVVGPFNVVDARVAVTQNVLDLEALEKTRARSAGVEAARYSYQDTRDLVVLACGNLYLQAVAEESRIAAAKAQLETAQAQHRSAADRKQAGMVPAVDVLRADVVEQQSLQRVIVAENRAARAKLDLARAIGLPAGQEFRLTDGMPVAATPAIGLDEALQKAYATRADWKAGLARVRAAEASRRSALGEGLPTVDVSADYGAIGNTLGGAFATYTLGAALHVPLFEGGKVVGKVIEADAALQAERASLEDLRGRIDYEVRTAFLDLRAAQDRVTVAARAVEAAQAQLRQAQDRFESGVASNIDVVQAQQAAVEATENDISAAYDRNLARAQLARALGVAEQAFKNLARGE